MRYSIQVLMNFTFALYLDFPFFKVRMMHMFFQEDERISLQW